MRSANVAIYPYKGTSHNISSPYEVILPKGRFFIELWGCSGPTSPRMSYGSYVSGVLELNKSTPFYLHVCHQGVAQSAFGAYGGGGPGQIGSGGATDIRLKSGSYEEFDGLKSRIIVASGAGGHDSNGSPGAGGGLFGFNSTEGYGLGGTQTHGGQSGVHGSFGFGGGNASRLFIIGEADDGNGAGGSGYFGGGSSDIQVNYAGGGGSSFISVHPGCIAVAEDFTEQNMKFSTNEDQSIHYSGIRFTNTHMIDGNSPCPSPNYVDPSYKYNANGHPNNGLIRITKLSSFMCTAYINYSSHIRSLYFYVFIVLDLGNS